MGVALLVAWRLWPDHRSAQDPGLSPNARTAEPEPERESADAPPPPSPRRPSPAAGAPDGAVSPAEDSRAAPADDGHAHPITPEHVRLFAHRRLGHAIDEATDARDVGTLRALLDQYHREYPRDEFGVEAAYRLILDCFEHPGADTRAAAARWLDQNNGSVVKRSIVRYCVDEPPR